MPALAVPLQAVIEIAGSDPEHEAAPDAIPEGADRLRPWRLPAAAAIPVANPDGAVKLIDDNAPSATVPAPEKAVPVGAERDTAETPPLVLQAPVASPSGAVSDNAERLPVAAAFPDAVPVAGDNDMAWTAPLAVAAPVADPSGADMDTVGRLPLAETPPLSTCEPKTKIFSRTGGTRICQGSLARLKAYACGSSLVNSAARYTFISVYLPISINFESAVVLAPPPESAVSPTMAPSWYRRR